MSCILPPLRTGVVVSGHSIAPYCWITVSFYESLVIKVIAVRQYIWPNFRIIVSRHFSDTAPAGSLREPAAHFIAHALSVNLRTPQSLRSLSAPFKCLRIKQQFALPDTEQDWTRSPATWRLPYFHNARNQTSRQSMWRIWCERDTSSRGPG